MTLNDSNAPAFNSPQSADDETKVLRARLRQRRAPDRGDSFDFETLFSHDSIEMMLEQTLTLAMETLDAGAGAVLLYETGRDALIFRCASGPERARTAERTLPTHQGIAGRVFRSGQLRPHHAIPPAIPISIAKLHHAIWRSARALS